MYLAIVVGFRDNHTNSTVLFTFVIAAFNYTVWNTYSEIEANCE